MSNQGRHRHSSSWLSVVLSQTIQYNLNNNPTDCFLFSDHRRSQPRQPSVPKLPGKELLFVIRTRPRSRDAFLYVFRILFHSVLRSCSQIPTDNPFARRESHSAVSITTYRILTILSWLLVTIATIYYTIHAPHDDVKKRRNTIWGHNKPTPFALNVAITSIYW